MQQNLILTMSLAGTTVFLLYFIIYQVAKKHFSAQWRYRILKISLAFYLLPLPYYEPMMKDLVRNVLALPERALVLSSVHLIDDLNVIIKNGGAISLSANMQRTVVLACILGIVSLSIIFAQLYRYIETRKACLSRGANSPSPFLLEKLKNIKKSMGMKTNAKLILSEFCQQPMVIGVFKPTIVFPLLMQGEIGQKEWEYSIRHELVHIKRQDLLIRFIGLLVMAVHWFNPFAYLVFRELSVISEICCDDSVLENENISGKKKYCHFIVNLAAENKFFAASTFSVGLFNNDLRTIRRRILEMKTIEKTKKRVLSYVLCAVICLAGATTALAYEPPLIMEIENGQEVEFNGECIFIEDIYLEDEFGKMPYDKFFTDESGNIIEIRDVKAPPKAGCIHSFKAGAYTEHETESDGGCTVLSYKAKICTKCGYTVVVELDSTQTFVQCPH